MVCFQTAYLKAHYPTEFMASLMTSAHSRHDKIAKLMEECRRSGIQVLPPDANSSDERFTVKDGKILFGLSAIKGVGQGAIEVITAARKGEPFKDLFDFCKRVSGGKVNKKVIEALIKSGAMDKAGGASRSVMLASLEKALKEKPKEEPAFKVHSLFGPLEGESSQKGPKWEEASEMSEEERLEQEKDCLGFYVSGHPLEKFDEAVSAFGFSKIKDILKTKTKVKCRASGVISSLKIKRDKKDKEYAFATLEDASGKIELLIWSRSFAKARKLLQDESRQNRMMVVEGFADPQSADSRFGSAKIMADELWPLEESLESRMRSLSVKVPLHKLRAFTEYVSSKDLFKRTPERPVFYVRVKEGPAGEGIYRLDNTPRITLSFLSEAAKILGSGAFRFSDAASPPEG
jgi:DNA polymerase-3 subunit alpha